MKLIIDIPEEDYKIMKHNIAVNNPLCPLSQEEMVSRVANGIPLDDVKEEIAEETCLTDNPYTKETKYTIEHSRLLEIFDNIGRAERGKRE